MVFQTKSGHLKLKEEALEMSSTIQVGLEDLPVVNTDNFLDFENDQSVNIAHYLHQALNKYADDLKEVESLLFPSVSEIGMYLLCKDFEVYDAVKILRQNGYQIKMMDFHRPLTIERISTQPLTIKENMLDKAFHFLNSLLSTNLLENKLQQKTSYGT